MAVCTEHVPDRGPLAFYADNLGTTLEGPAALSMSADTTSLPHMSFADLLAMIQFFETNGRVPDSFLDSSLVCRCCA